MSTNSQIEHAVLEGWISQADAARLRGVSRQAISKLVHNGRVSTLEVGGMLFLRESEVRYFSPATPGRRSKGAANGRS